MQLTKGAIGNLINRYKAVLKKCHLLNVFGSLAVAGMLVMGGADVVGATAQGSIIQDTTISEYTEVIGDSYVESGRRKAGISSQDAPVTVTIKDGASLIVTVSQALGENRIYGAHSESGNTLKIIGNTSYHLVSNDADARLFRASKGDIVFNGNVDGRIEGGSNIVVGAEVWEGSTMSFSGDSTRIIITSTGGQIIGVQNWNSQNGTINFNSADTIIHIQNTSDSNSYTQGILAYQSTTNFTGNVELVVAGGNQDSYGVNVECDPGNQYDTVVNFSGDKTYIDVSATGNVYAVSPSGVPGIINFTGKELIVKATSQEGSADGFLSQYGAHLNVSADTLVTAKGKTSAYGVQLTEYANYAGNARFTGDLQAIAETEHGQAFAVYNCATATGATQADDGKLTATGNVSLSAMSQGGDALGIYSVGEYAEVRLGGVGKRVNVVATSQKDGGKAYGIFAENNSKIAVMGNTSVVADGTNAFAVAADSGAQITLGAAGDSVNLTAVGINSVGVQVDSNSTVHLNGDTTIVADNVFAGNGNVVNNGNLIAESGTFADFTGMFTQASGATNIGKADFGGKIDVTGGALHVNDELTLKQGITVHRGSTVDIIDGRLVIDGGTADFKDGSLLTVDGKATATGNAAITVNTGSALDIASKARLRINNAAAGNTYTIINPGASTTDSWKNIEASSDMVGLEMKADGTVSAKAKDAADVFTDMDGDTVSLLNGLYGKGLNDTDADAMGVRFLSRATDNRFLGSDKDAAAATIESAARIAFAGAVPQMTKMASDAGTNAVVNRLGFADPADGAQAMDADGKIVDRNTTGFALWIAPLWQSQHGWGMDADSMDYGFNGNLGGVSLGADYTFENAIRAGITFNIGGGYAESSGGDLSSTDNRMNFWGLGAYAGWNYENFGVMADVSYTSTWNQLKQDVDSRMGMGDLEADVQATAISAGLRAEYLLQTSAMDIIPHIGVRYMSLNTWGYDVDTHGGTVLEGDSLHQDIWTFPIGVTFSKDFALDSGWSFKPSLDFTVIPAAGDIKAKHDVHFTGLPGTYEVETQMMDYLTWQGGVGLELANDNMSIGVNYTLQAGQHTTGHGVFGSFRYEF